MNIDICILDFDGCLYPGISNVDVALDIIRSIFITPTSLQDRKFLPTLGYAGIYLLGARVLQKMGSKITDGQLVESYVRLMEKTPHHYYRSSIESISHRIYPGAIETISWLCRKCSVAIISLAFQDVLDMLDENLFRKTGNRLTAKIGNPFDLQEIRLPKAVLTREDKNRHMRELMQDLGLRSPLVIGNDQEDLGLVDQAHTLGGVAIGFRPRPGIRWAFDRVVEDQDWRGMPQVLSEFFREK